MRTRAERRHNTRTVQQRRKNSLMCHSALTPAGERCDCTWCKEGKFWDWMMNKGKEINATYRWEREL